MHRAIRSLAFALALLVLASGAVHARPLAARHSTGVLDVLWQFVSSHLPSWTQEGSTTDPNGAPRSGSITNSGGAMDPDGYTTKEGGTMDPDGNRHNGSAPLPRTDAGSTMDPNG